MPIIQELTDDIALLKTEPADFTVQTTTYAGMRIFVDIKGQDGEALASVVKGATFAKPRRWEPAKVSCVFLPTDISNAKRHASALARAIEEAELLDRLYPPGTEGNDLYA